MKWKDFCILHAHLDPEEEVACILWQKADVFEKSSEEYPNVVMTTEIAEEILCRMDRKSDCETGITWSSLEYHLEAVLREQKLI